MRHGKSTSKREVQNDTSLPWETRKISNKQPNLTPKGTRTRRTNKTQMQQKIKAEISGIETNKTENETENETMKLIKQKTNKMKQ